MMAVYFLNTKQIIESLLPHENIKTIAELERAVGLSNGTIGKWNKNNSSPSYGSLIKIADYFNVSTDYLYGKTDDPLSTLEIPEKIKNVYKSFGKKEFLELTKDEIDQLAKYAVFIKSQRET
jgi:transcriptional regulator with XRE-family HTH domain